MYFAGRRLHEFGVWLLPLLQNSLQRNGTDSTDSSTDATVFQNVDNLILTNPTAIAAANDPFSSKNQQAAISTSSTSNSVSPDSTAASSNNNSGLSQQSSGENNDVVASAVSSTTTTSATVASPTSTTLAPAPSVVTMPPPPAVVQPVVQPVVNTGPSSASLALAANNITLATLIDQAQAQNMLYVKPTIQVTSVFNNKCSPTALTVGYSNNDDVEPLWLISTADCQRVFNGTTNGLNNDNCMTSTNSMITFDCRMRALKQLRVPLFNLADDPTCPLLGIIVNGERLYRPYECLTMGGIQYNVNNNGYFECYRWGGGSISWDCRDPKYTAPDWMGDLTQYMIDVSKSPYNAPSLAATSN